VLEATDGRNYEFSIQAFDECGPIGTGKHKRVSVKAERFQEKAEQKRAK
jgi:predicted thioesterase